MFIVLVQVSCIWLCFASAPKICLALIIIIKSTQKISRYQHPTYQMGFLKRGSVRQNDSRPTVSSDSFLQQKEGEDVTEESHKQAVRKRRVRKD